MARYYFEQSPWDKAVECISDNQLGHIAEISIHCVCPEGKMNDVFNLWKDRVDGLLGSILRESEITGESTMSYIAKYENKTIIRIFIDEDNNGICDNFEIVTDKALLVWKPSSRPQSIVVSGGAGRFDLTQAYSVELEMI